MHDLGTKQRIVYESDEPVTGVQLTTQESSTTLFISTTSRILQLALSRRGQGSPPKTIEDSGCAAGCMTVDPKTGDIVVARDDAIYTYRLDGRGPPRAYESPKRLISIHNNYIAVAGPSSVSSSRDPDAIRRRFGSATADGLFNAWTFVLLEGDLRVIGHTETLISPVRFIFEVWGDLFTITEEGKVWLPKPPLLCIRIANAMPRFTGIMRSRSSSAWKCSTSGTCSPSQSSWRRTRG